MKKYDPRMHTAEHILNQTMVRMFRKGRSIRAHIEKKKSRIDFRLDSRPTDEEIENIENQVNKIVQDNLPITEEYLSIEEAAEKYSLRKLPEDAGEKIRIVKIGDYDACPCSGQHVNSSGEVGRFKITTSNFENGIFRIRFKLFDE